MAERLDIDEHHPAVGEAGDDGRVEDALRTVEVVADRGGLLLKRLDQIARVEDPQQPGLQAGVERHVASDLVQVEAPASVVVAVHRARAGRGHRGGVRSWPIDLCQPGIELTGRARLGVAQLGEAPVRLLLPCRDPLGHEPGDPLRVLRRVPGQPQLQVRQLGGGDVGVGRVRLHQQRPYQLPIHGVQRVPRAEHSGGPVPGQRRHPDHLADRLGVQLPYPVAGQVVARAYPGQSFGLLAADPEPSGQQFSVLGFAFGLHRDQLGEHLVDLFEPE